MLKHEMIKNFWNWFQSNEELLQPQNISKEFTRELELELKKIGIFAWEIGPSEAIPIKQYFALPLMRDTEHDGYMRELIELAPNIAGWVFQVGLPPKKWKRKILWGPECNLVDANEWHFQIFKYPDGLHDLILVLEKRFLRKQVDMEEVLFTVAESELGQVLMDDLIYSVKIQLVKNKSDVSNLVSIEKLKKTLIESKSRIRIN